MTLNALRKSQHESQAFQPTERIDCAAGSWNVHRSLFRVVVAGIADLDCSRKDRRTEANLPALCFRGPVIILLFVAKMIRNHPCTFGKIQLCFLNWVPLFQRYMLPFPAVWKSAVQSDMSWDAQQNSLG